MAVFKCKMCGGDLEILENATVCECGYCGTKQTLPKLNDEKRVQLYDRANYFRRENEFDKAMGIYEMILSEANDDAESYWGIVLCRYGIEYVEDPRTHRRIPTVNRAQFTSIFDDEDYKKALEYADVLQKELYEAEATVIDKIQKGILDISNKEDPFDIFICYKETDENGQRTKDSVYAQSIYDWLVKQGYKVFFSRITLEDKLGSAYEPYIFAALNSARVMLVVGTKKEYFNAVWVKNEWSRYLSLIKAGKEKTIIPVYKDISPYDLPEEFQYLQAQDMNKIGFSQDLGRGIRKLIPINELAQETVVVNNGANATVDSLLKRVTMFLEDGDFNSADEYCEKVLDIDPENASAYLGKLMAELQVKKQPDLEKCNENFADDINYQKALRFADEKLRQYLERLIKVVEENKKENLYRQATEYLSTNNVENLKNAISIFEALSSWKDSLARKQECCIKLEELLEMQEKNRIEQEKQIERDKQEHIKRKVASLVRPVCLLGIVWYAFAIVGVIPNILNYDVTAGRVCFLLFYIGEIFLFVIALKKSKIKKINIAKVLTLCHSVGFINCVVETILSVFYNLQYSEINPPVLGINLVYSIFAYLLPGMCVFLYFKNPTQSRKIFSISSVLLSIVVFVFYIVLNLMYISSGRLNVYNTGILWPVLGILMDGFVLRGVVKAYLLITEQ